MAADATDVDLEVTLTELRPDGQEQLIQSGWLRASHRALDEAASTALRPRHLHTAAAEDPLTAGEVTPLRVELFPVARVPRGLAGAADDRRSGRQPLALGLRADARVSADPA